MADHALVDKTISFLRTNWNSANAPQPVIIDRDNADSQDYNGRRVMHDLTDDNVLSVGSSPERTESPIGTEFDYDVQDGVGIRVEAAHEDEFGHVTGASEFRDIWREARRAILVERAWPWRNASGDQHWRWLETANVSNVSSGDKDYYRIDADVLWYAWEDLP